MTATTTWPTTADGKWLVLRTVDADWRSRDGFRWHKTVETVTPDWDPDPGRDCGGGLHGLLWGCGDAGLLSSDPDAVWLVVAVDVVDVANPDQAHKVRFRAGQVRFHGTRDEAVDYLMAHGAAGLPVVYGTATAGHGGTATAGHGGTATAGNDGTLIIAWYDRSRPRRAVGYIGEDGLKPDTPYRVNIRGEFVEVKS